MRRNSGKKWIWGALALTAGLLCAAGLLRGKKSGEPLRKSTVAMGAVVTQTVYAESDDAANRIALEASAAVSALENRISWRIEGSEIDRANGGESILLSDRVAELLRMCQSVAEKSGGAFDVSVLPASRLWDFEAEVFKVPDAQMLAQAVAHCGAAQIQLTGNTLTVQAGAGLDLGAVGKGAGCDEALAVYAASGARAGLIAVGGSVGVSGEKPDGSAWSVGVRDPRGDESALLGTLTLRSGCVSTSGTYEKQREANGVSYHHILNPKTGLPVETDLISATVLCSSGAQSDALATAAVALGSTQGAALLDGYGVDYLLITENNELIYGGKMESLLTVSSTEYKKAEG